MGSSLTERDKNVIWHPYSPQKYIPEPIPVVKGRGSWIFDENGSKYLDAISSWWVTIHGHAHPYIADKIYKQALELEQVIFAGFTHEPAVTLAEKLLAILPGNFSKIFYSDNGSTAVEVAIKMAIQYWWNKGETKRTRILALSHSYHGDTFGAMSVSERGLFTLAFQDRLFEVVFVPAPEKNMPLAVPLDEFACVIYEPLIQGAGGMNVYTSEALDQFIALCRSHGVICIADEVMTGFGRTGKMFASEYCDNKPDIVCLSKGLTGGTMAMGVTACNKIIHDAFVVDDNTKTFFHGHSFTANPIACAAAIASLELFEKENTFLNIERIVRTHAEFAKKIALIDGVENVRQCGTVVCFEVRSEVEGYTSSVRDKVTSEGLKREVYVRPLGNTVYLMPPYCTSAEEMNLIYDAVFDIIKTI